MIHLFYLLLILLNILSTTMAMAPSPVPGDVLHGGEESVFTIKHLCSRVALRHEFLNI